LKHRSQLARPDSAINRTGTPVTNRRDDCLLNATFKADQAKLGKDRQTAIV